MWFLLSAPRVHGISALHGIRVPDEYTIAIQVIAGQVIAGHGAGSVQMPNLLGQGHAGRDFHMHERKSCILWFLLPSARSYFYASGKCTDVSRVPHCSSTLALKGTVYRKHASGQARTHRC